MKIIFIIEYGLKKVLTVEQTISTAGEDLIPPPVRVLKRD